MSAFLHPPSSVTPHSAFTPERQGSCLIVISRFSPTRCGSYSFGKFLKNARELLVNSPRSSALFLFVPRFPRPVCLTS
jgi:hypothetical protein